MTHTSHAAEEVAYVSTGELPEGEQVQRQVDEAYGNSVNAQRVAKFLSARLGMDLLISSPAEEPSHAALPAS